MASAISAGGGHHHDLAGIGGVNDGSAGGGESAVVVARYDSRGGNTRAASGKTATSALATDKNGGSEHDDQREREYFFHFLRNLPTKPALKNIGTRKRSSRSDGRKGTRSFTNCFLVTNYYSNSIGSSFNLIFFPILLFLCFFIEINSLYQYNPFS